MIRRHPHVFGTDKVDSAGQVKKRWREIKKEEKKAKQAKERQARKRNCEVAKMQLKGYERAGYLFGIDKDGKKVIRSNEERHKATENMRKKVKKYCN